MPAIDDFVGRSPNVPYTSAAAVTPHDTNELTNVSRALSVGSVAGGTTMTVLMVDGQTVQFTVSAGQVLPIRVRRVNATGTLASAIVALW